MASGKLEFVDNPKLGKVGDKVKVGTEEAFIVGRNSSQGAKTAKEAVEKGGVSRFVDELVEIAEQGSLEYLKKTIQDTAESSDELKRRTARQLAEALEEGKVKYMVVQQRFTKADDIGQFTIKEFDITR